jgi:integrase/recombinase XerD
MSLVKQANRFLNYCAVERQLSENTLHAYRYDLADFGEWLPVRFKLAAIKTEALRDYLENMRTERRLSAGTVRRRIACLRSFFRYLNEEGILTDPFVGWRLKLPRRKRLPRALSRDETGMLLASADIARHAKRSLRARSLGTEIRLMIATGIRVGELCKLYTSDVWQDGSALRIRGKGSRDRLVYIGDTKLRIELLNLASLRQRLLGEPGPLFVNRHGTGLKPHSFRSKLRAIAGEVGLKRRVTPHMLRHTAATLLMENGVDIRIVQRLLGHSSIATTEIYTHVSDETLRKVLERANVLAELAT